MFSRFTHAVAFIGTSFLFVAKQYPVVRKEHILSNRLSVDGYLGCFHFLAILNNAAINIGVKCLVEHLFPILLGTYLKLDFLDHRVTHYLTT